VTLGRTVRFRVFGRVQGVGFRWWTRSQALDLGLTGSVRNLDDGSVEVIATGTPDRLHALRVALQRGPAAAKIDRVDESPAPTPERAGFEIDR
jgi:acylphosphatase